MIDDPRLPAGDRVEIHFGPVINSTDPREIGTNRFFIDVVESDGTHNGTWDGTDYEEAIMVAHELAEQWGCEVVDMVVPDTDKLL